MAIADQVIKDEYALYNGDCIEVMSALPSQSIHMSIYSPPFCGLYNYSSDERDLSNCDTFDQFFEHYDYVVEQIHRLTKPGRITAVHCAEIPSNGANLGGDNYDLPGEIIRQHKRLGWEYAARYHVWKEPLGVRNRTMSKGLSHFQVTQDSTLCDVAAADYLLMFRKKGENPEPVTHPVGLMRYAGSREVPQELLKYRGYTGKQTMNKYSHWIWRRYADAFWDDVRIDRVLPYKEARDKDDERHVHPLQLDVIERALTLWSNEGDKVLTPFMGVGSEVYGARLNNRFAVGIELKDSYYRQAVKNMEECVPVVEQPSLFDEVSHV